VYWVLVHGVLGFWVGWVEGGKGLDVDGRPETYDRDRKQPGLHGMEGRESGFQYLAYGTLRPCRMNTLVRFPVSCEPANLQTPNLPRKLKFKIA
jgi:hypothetical protein